MPRIRPSNEAGLAAVLAQQVPARAPLSLHAAKQRMVRADLASILHKNDGLAQRMMVSRVPVEGPAMLRPCGYAGPGVAKPKNSR